MSVKFYDTCSLLKLGEKVLEDECFYISSVTLEELESIKTSKVKSDSIKYQARNVVRLLKDNAHKYVVIIYCKDIETLLVEKHLELTPDNKICACAASMKDVVFVSDDILCQLIAKNIFGLDVHSVNDKGEDRYNGFIEVSMTETEMADFYENPKNNKYGLLCGQYIVVKDMHNEVVDVQVWTKENQFSKLKIPNIKSNYFGAFKPKDIYQQMALDSISNNAVTMLTGSPGTGKTKIAIEYLYWMLEKHKIDKIVVFVNPVKVINSAELGFYKGTRSQKTLENSDFLSAKFGGQLGLEQLMNQGKIEVLPVSDIRGYDTTDMNAGVYIAEAQNMDINLMKVALQRISENTPTIIDGDFTAQVDSHLYAGSKNGMKRTSEVFRGQDFYGEVELQKIYRSRIADIAQQM